MNDGEVEISIVAVLKSLVTIQSLPLEIIPANLQHLARSNISLSDAEAAQIRQLIASDPRIKVILSPMRSLPTEILSQIFASMVNGLVDCFELYHGPWTIAQVCSRWRNLALSLPKLWSFMYIDLGKAIYYRSPANILSRWLGRSKNHQLHIKAAFNSSHPYPNLRYKVSSLLLKKLALRCERWHTFSIHLTKDTNLEILDGIIGHLPHLQCLAITMPECDDDDMDKVFQYFEGAPHLTQFELKSDEHDPLLHNPLPSDFPRRWRNITSLFLDCELDLETAVRALSSLTQLTKFTFHGFIDDDVNNVPSPNSPIAISHLTSLELATEKQILSYITCPNLSNLEIGDLSLDDDAHKLTAFLRRSVCHDKLNHLSLDGECVAGEEVMAELQNMPNLRKLSLTNTTVNNDLFRLLTILPDQQIILPRLYKLYIHTQCSVRLPDPTIILQMLESRWRIPDERLQKFTFLCEHDVLGAHFSDHFSELRQEGMLIIM